MGQPKLVAHLTRTVGHGARYVLTRAFLPDGRVMERLNPGVPDEGELPWKEIGRYTDLLTEKAALQRDGWAIEP